MPSKENITEQPTDKVKDKILLSNKCIFSQQQFLGGKGAEALANEECSGTVSNIYAAMDEYSKQMSIAFAKWMDENYNRMDMYKNNDLWTSRKDLFEDNPITTDDCYNLFIESQKQ